MTWKQTTEERYYDMLGVVPPVLQLGYAFLVGEASTHRTCRVTGVCRPAFLAFDERAGSFRESVEPLTLAEFRLAIR